MRDALASWHIGKVIAAYRRHPYHGRPVSQQIVAGCVRTGQAQLSRIESGPPIRDLDRLIQWAKLLGIPEDLLWFKLPHLHQMSNDPPPKPTSNAHLVYGGRRRKRASSDNELPSLSPLPVTIDAELPASVRVLSLTSTTPLQQRSALLTGSSGLVALPVLRLDDLEHMVAALDDAWRYAVGTTGTAHHGSTKCRVCGLALSVDFRSFSVWAVSRGALLLLLGGSRERVDQCVGDFRLH
ncbi:MAG: helix-turn-helix domain-containing protein [Egibacteraceae bacterium]